MTRKCKEDPASCMHPYRRNYGLSCVKSVNLVLISVFHWLSQRTNPCNVLCLLKKEGKKSCPYSQYMIVIGIQCFCVLNCCYYTDVLLRRNLFLYVLKCSVSFAQHETNTCKVQKCSGDFWCSNWKTKARGTGLKLKFRFRFSRNWCLIPSINKYLLVYLCCVVGLLWLTGSLNVVQHFIVWKYLVDYRNRNKPIILIVGN